MFGKKVGRSDVLRLQADLGLLEPGDDVPGKGVAGGRLTLHENGAHLEQLQGAAVALLERRKLLEPAFAALPVANWVSEILSHVVESM